MTSSQPDRDDRLQKKTEPSVVLAGCVPRTGAHVGCFPVPRGLPRITGGSASATSLSRPAQASLELRPVGSLNRPRRPLSQGFDSSVTRTNRLPATRSNRQLSGWFLPPLVIRAFWAHVESRRGAVAWALWASLRFLSPLIKPDVRISRIRLPDRLHLKAHGGGPRWTRCRRITPNSPNMTVSGKRMVPRDDTLWPVPPSP